MTTSRLVRKALGTLIREALEARGLPVVIKHDSTGAIRYEIAGELLSPGEVADRFDIKWGTE